MNKLGPNLHEIEYMIIGHQLKTRNLDLPETSELNGSDITRVDKSKYLGVIIDKYLDWDEEFKRIGS